MMVEQRPHPRFAGRRIPSGTGGEAHLRLGRPPLGVLSQQGKQARQNIVDDRPSDWGLGLERTRLVCDDRLHLTDPAGQAPCPSCGKALCRACAPAG